MKAIPGLLFFFALLPAFATEVSVSDPETARKAVRDAKPGDVIVLATGEWKDADLRLDGEGEAGNPIVVRAEEPGKTVFTGASRIRIGGDHLVLSGVSLVNLSGTNTDWLEFRIDSKRRANHSRVTNCLFTENSDFAAGELENRWIGIYGEANQIDRCTIEGKKNKGATLVVWLGEEDPGRHRILANLFRDRPRLGKNGGETIRIGDSKSSMQKADCVVEGNLFSRCDGETECISNKSCGNVYRGNWFHETQGTLTLRHGHDCLVEGNTFIGGTRGQTGGVRVIGRGHKVIWNTFLNLEGDGFRSALCLVNGIPESPDNGYHQVIGAEIRNNTFSGCRESVVIGYNDVKDASLPPKNVVFEGNRIIAKDGRPAVRVETRPESATWKDNLYRDGGLIGMEEGDGLKASPFELAPDPELPEMDRFGVTWRLPIKSLPASRSGKSSNHG